MSNPVQNVFPKLSIPQRIAVVGEAPGTDEEALGTPFVGYSGRFLNATLSKAGIPRDGCFIGNVCQHRPPNNKLDTWTWSHEHIQSGLCQLKKDIETFKPNIVVLLGNLALKAAKDPETNHALKPGLYRNKVGNWRGSLWLAEHPLSPVVGMKCISTLHPAYVLRDYDTAPLLLFDMQRASKEGFTSSLNLPQRTLATNLTLDETLFRLANIRELRTPVAIDIEGGVGTLSCISFATAPERAFIIPFIRKDGSSYWSEEQEPRLWKALAETLEDPAVPKILQNSLYDRFVLHYSYGIRVRGVADDTMLKHWELYAELPKALGVQTSIYTREPFYKGDRKTNDDKTFYEYCCKDSAVTIEICSAITLRRPSIDHYTLNMALLCPLLYMEIRGIAYDSQGAALRRNRLRKALFEAQATLNGLCGRCLSYRNLEAIRQVAQAKMCYKKDCNVPKKQYVEDWRRFNELLRRSNPDLATIGEIEDLCGIGINVSAPIFRTLLYDCLDLPKQHNTDDKGQETLTADYEALLKLTKHVKDRPDDDLAKQVVSLGIEIRALDTRQRMLSIRSDHDGRIRCGYNIVGTETGRISCYTSPTGSGYNLQTIPNYTLITDAPGKVLGDRDLFTADPDHWFFQCDLAGADGWTVAAYSAMLGDRTMLDDYLFGIKPAQTTLLKMLGVDVDFNNRDAIKDAASRSPKGWEYFACKRIHHGVSYMEGKITISRQIFKDSEGKFFLPTSECEALKQWFLSRYWGVKLYHNWVGSQIARCSELTAASGQVRKFFGRPEDKLTKAVAFEPQANTTFATNLAMYNLWSDNDNRLHDNSLKIQPLHQVHDALCGQFPKADTAWAVGKIRSWFDNPLRIAGETITIPFDGSYGDSWGSLNEGKI